MGMVGGRDGDWVAGVVAEALRAQREGAAFELKLLGRKALMERAWPGVRWEEHTKGGALLLKGHGDNARPGGHALMLAACDGRVCCGLFDGSIRVWSRASGEHERTLGFPEDAEEEEEGLSIDGDDFVEALAVWQGRLISSHRCGELRVWNVATGECAQVLEGHSCPISA